MVNKKQSNANEIESVYRRTPKPETDSGSKLSMFKGTPIASCGPHIKEKNGS